MKHWTTHVWFKSITIVAMSAFFAVYGIDLVALRHMPVARAQSVDDLLNDDDSGITHAKPAKPAKPSKPAYDDEDETPAKAKPVAKPSKPAYDDEDETPVKAKPAAKPSKPAYDDEDEAPAKGKAVPAKAVFDDEDKAPVKAAAKAAADDDEDVTPAKPVKASANHAKTVLGPRVDGPTKVLAIVFPADEKSKAQAAQHSQLVHDYLRSNPVYTDVPLNGLLGDTESKGERAAIKDAKKKLDDAMRSFRDGAYDTAIDAFDAAALAYAPWLELRDYQDIFASILAGSAASYIKNSDKKDGREVFQRLLQWNPRYTLAGDFDADVRAEFNRAKDERDDAPKGDITINSDPSGATVYVDGHFRGLSGTASAPLKITGLVAGDHFIKVVEPGLKDGFSKVTVYENMSKPVPFKLAQTNKYYEFKADVTAINGKFEHRKMWGDVKALLETTKADKLLLSRVSEKNGNLTIESFYYDPAARQYKSLSDHVAVLAEDAEQSAISHYDQLFDDDEVDWQSTFFKETKQEPVAAKSAAKPLYKEWWLWTIVGVVAAGAVGTALALTVFKKDSSKSDDKGNGLLIVF